MELVEQHRTDALKRGVIDDQTGEHALGDHLDAGPGADLGAEPSTHPDRLTDVLAERLGHALRGAAGRETTRFQDEDLAPREPRLVEQRQRHARRLASPGRGDQHGGRAGAQRRDQRRQSLVNRQGLGEAHGGWVVARNGIVDTGENSIARLVKQGLRLAHIVPVLQPQNVVIPA